MKQRIFIAIHYLEIGGAESSLLGLLNALDVALYDIDLFIYSHQGEFMRMIPKKIRLLPEIPQYAALERPLKEIVKNGHWKIAFARLRAKMCIRDSQYTFRQLYKLWRIDYVFYSEFLKGQDCFSPDAPYSDHNMVVWRGILLK